jgi:heterodisulfide reductase subunit A
MARTGVFVCWCGSNIAKTVDVEQVAEQAGQLPGVAHSVHYKYMCSEPGQAMLRQAVTDHRLDRIVVAACSPRLHETTFRTCIAQAGLNPGPQGPGPGLRQEGMLRS